MGTAEDVLSIYEAGSLEAVLAEPRPVFEHGRPSLRC